MVMKTFIRNRQKQLEVLMRKMNRARSIATIITLIERANGKGLLQWVIPVNYDRLQTQARVASLLPGHNQLYFNKGKEKYKEEIHFFIHFPANNELLSRSFSIYLDDPENWSKAFKLFKNLRLKGN